MYTDSFSYKKFMKTKGAPKTESKNAGYIMETRKDNQI